MDCHFLLQGIFPTQGSNPGLPEDEVQDSMLLTCIMSPRASLVAQMVKHLPAMQETRLRFLGLEDPLEKEMAIYSRYLPYSWLIDTVCIKSFVFGLPSALRGLP